MSIPKEIEDFLLENPSIGRIRLAKKFGLTDRDARFYLQLFRKKYDIDAQKEKLELSVKAFSEGLIEKLKSESLVKPPKFKNIFKGKLKESAVLVISDVHAGKVNDFLDPETNEIVRTYDFDIFIDKANNLVHKVYEVIELLSGHYQIDTLYIYFVGDIVDNDFIYRGQKFFIDGDTGEQLQVAVKVFSDILNSFLKIFKHIHVVSVPGNHGRHTSRSEASPASRNFDYHFSWILSTIFASVDRITFEIPNSYFYYPRIYDWVYFLHHGNDVYSWMCLSPYSKVLMANRTERKLFEIRKGDKVINGAGKVSIVEDIFTYSIDDCLLELRTDWLINEPLYLTPNHKLPVIKRVGAWQELMAKDISVGDYVAIIDSDGNKIPVRVASIKKIPYRGEVMDLQLNENHYYVANSIVVHNSMPYYGIVRKSKARRAEYPFDMEIIGHFHTTMEIPITSKAYTLINGSWIAKDAYSYEKFGVFTKAEQYFFGVSSKRPRTWTFVLDLS